MSSLTDSFLAAHICTDSHSPMLCKHIHRNFSPVYCNICPVTLSVYLSHSLRSSCLCGLLTVTEAYVKGTPILRSPTTVCPPTGYRRGLSSQQLPDVHHHFSLGLPQLLQHHHGGGLRRYARLSEHEATTYDIFEHTNYNKGRDVVDVKTD